jgi:hypothetical protein
MRNAGEGAVWVRSGRGGFLRVHVVPAEPIRESARMGATGEDKLVPYHTPWAGRAVVSVETCMAIQRDFDSLVGRKEKQDGKR